MKSGKIILISVFIILFNACKDVIFNNPIDPDASKAQLQVIKVISTPVYGRGDLAFDGEKLWKISEDGSLYALDMESGAVIRTIFTEPGTGLAFLEDSLFVCGGSNILSSLDPLSGDLLNRISTIDLYPAYLASENDSLILYDTRSSSFFDYRPGTGEAERLFQVSGIAVGGMETFGGGILITDMNTDSIYHFSPGGDIIDVYRSPALGVGGIAVDNRENIYLFTLDGNIHKVSLP